MKVKPEYMLRKVVETYVIIGTGDAAYAPNQIMSLNETGAFLWKALEQGAQRQELVDSLTREYDVDAPTAERDLDAFLAALRERNLIDE